MNCPKCNSSKVELVEYRDSSLIVCSDCGYDERDEYEVVPEERSNQKEKGRYSPYKTGGGKRSSK